MKKKTENRVMDSRRRSERSGRGKGRGGPSNSEAIYDDARKSHSFPYQGNRRKTE